jgi:transcriptional regulator with XRE-family HTH domain
MRTSTIAKHRVSGTGTPFTLLLGAEIRRRRLERGLSQHDLGQPLSRSFVSLVEHGQLTPSLPSLRLLATRLGTTAAGILAPVEAQMEDRPRG